jgi:uncharacterized membrane protein YcaP (DUF421 family)
MDDFFAKNDNLTMLEMGTRAFLIFFVALLLIRLAGIRAFGIRSAFDNIIILLLGAILSRAVVGASSFFPTVVASFVLVVLHRIFAFWSLYNHFIGWIFKGKAVPLYLNGRKQRKNMHRTLISDEDLHESVRLEGNVEDFKEIDAAYLERNGEISVVKKHEI